MMIDYFIEYPCSQYSLGFTLVHQMIEDVFDKNDIFGIIKPLFETYDDQDGPQNVIGFNIVFENIEDAVLFKMNWNI